PAVRDAHLESLGAEVVLERGGQIDLVLDDQHQSAHNRALACLLLREGDGGVAAGKRRISVTLGVMRRWWSFLALCAGLAGCIQSQLVPCGELACPAGLVCTPGGCAAQEDVDACVGVPEGELCTSERTPA